MRKFTLVNARGETLDITSKINFLHEPEGLGFTTSSEYRRSGNRYRRVYKAYEQGKLTGTMYFTEERGAEPYESYKEFIRFCSLEPLELHYTPKKTEYIAECVLSSIEKSELDEFFVLECPVEFTLLTMWRTIVERNVEFKTVTTGGWVWSQAGDVSFPIKWKTSSSSSTIVESDTNTESPCKLTVFGPANEPTWRTYCDGKLSGSGKIGVTLEEGEKLVIDNTKEQLAITIYNAADEPIADAYQFADFSQDAFLSLYYGKNEIAVYSGDENSKWKLEAYLTYVSV